MGGVRDEDVEELMRFVEALPRGEVKRVLKEQWAALKAMARIGRRVMAWRGGTLSDDAIMFAAYMGLMAFLELTHKADLYVDVGVDEGVAMAMAAAEIFTPSFANIFSYRTKLAKRLYDELPEDEWKDEPQGKKRGKREGKKGSGE